MKPSRLRLVSPQQPAANPVQPAGPAGPVLHSNLTVIEVADPFLLQTLRADRRVGSAILAQLSDCVAIIQPGQGEWVIKQLLKAGHTPRVIDE
jgi:hypothetical protein